ncbi:MAG: AtpZ/AtpI family protein [Microthrixaceae bacterium]
MPIDLATTTHETTRQLNRSHGSFELALAPVILGLFGLWLDRRLGTVPVFLILFTVLGFAGAGIKIYYTYRYQMQQHQADVAWKGHESSEAFRAQTKARAQRLSVPLEDATNETAVKQSSIDPATSENLNNSNRATHG